MNDMIGQQNLAKAKGTEEPLKRDSKNYIIEQSPVLPGFCLQVSFFTIVI